VGDVIGKTQVKRKTLNPVYNEAFLFEHPLAAKDLQLTVFDWDPPGK
jgi:Ca2+-dependent lipid-binding protein